MKVAAVKYEIDRTKLTVWGLAAKAQTGLQIAPKNITHLGQRSGKAGKDKTVIPCLRAIFLTVDTPHVTLANQLQSAVLSVGRLLYLCGFVRMTEG